MDCSVIIPHLDQAEYLRKCLSALSLQKSAGFSFEVIVVDNGSKESLAEIEKEFNFQLINYHADKNPYICRNLGVEASSSNTIAFLDAKCTPHDKWLINGLKNLLQYDIVAGNYIVEHGSHLSSMVFPLMYLNNNKNVAHHYGASCGNLFMKKEVFYSLGQFEITSNSGNDILLTQKAISKNCSIGFAEDAAVNYPVKKFHALIKDIHKYGIGAAVTKQKGIVSALKFLLPMRTKTLQEAIAFRKYSFSFVEYIGIWLFIWRAKIEFAIGILKGLFSFSANGYGNFSNGQQ